jgi:hypothetical protein
MTQLINEARRFQQLANINGSQLNEVESQQQANLEKKAFEFFNSPKVSKFLDQALAKLSPEDKKELQSAVSNISEAMGNDFSSFLNVVHKAEEEASSLEEAENSDLKTKVGKVISGLGSVNIMSMGTLPALIGLAIDHFGGTNILQTVSQAVGDGSVAGGLSVIAGLVGGGILWAIGKKMQGIKDLGNEPIAEILDIDSVVNEALEAFRKENK